MLLLSSTMTALPGTAHKGRIVSMVRGYIVRNRR
jgi:hypothetical protein